MLSPVVCQHHDQIIAHRAVEPERAILLLKFEPAQHVDEVGPAHIRIEHLTLGVPPPFLEKLVGLGHRGNWPVVPACHVQAG